MENRLLAGKCETFATKRVHSNRLISARLRNKSGATDIGSVSDSLIVASSSKIQLVGTAGSHEPFSNLSDDVSRSSETGKRISLRLDTRLKRAITSKQVELELRDL